jgi:hypothetical protein
LLAFLLFFLSRGGLAGFEGHWMSLSTLAWDARVGGCAEFVFVTIVGIVKKSKRRSRRLRF